VIIHYNSNAEHVILEEFLNRASFISATQENYPILYLNIYMWFIGAASKFIASGA
jgi:hypothetical protein